MANKGYLLLTFFIIVLVLETVSAQTNSSTVNTTSVTPSATTSVSAQTNSSTVNSTSVTPSATTSVESSNSSVVNPAVSSSSSPTVESSSSSVMNAVGSSSSPTVSAQLTSSTVDTSTSVSPSATTSVESSSSSVVNAVSSSSTPNAAAEATTISPTTTAAPTTAAAPTTTAAPTTAAPTTAAPTTAATTVAASTTAATTTAATTTAAPTTDAPTTAAPTTAAPTTDAPTTAAPTTAAPTTAAPTTAKPTKKPAIVKVMAKMKIDQPYTEDFKNTSSDAFKTFEKDFVKAIKKSVSDHADVEIISIVSGSIIVNYTVTLKVTPGVDPVELLTAVIKSGKLGNFSVDKTYIVFVKNFPGVTLGDYKLNSTSYQAHCCDSTIGHFEMVRICTAASEEATCYGITVKYEVDCGKAEGPPKCSKADTLTNMSVAIMILGYIFSKILPV